MSTGEVGVSEVERALGVEPVAARAPDVLVVLLECLRRPCMCSTAFTPVSQLIKTPKEATSFSLLSSLELSDTKSMSLKYEPASEPLHIYVGKWNRSG